MKQYLEAAGIALFVLAAAASSASLSPAVAGPVYGAPPSGPVCVAGFATIKHKSWILECSKTVPIAQMGVAVTQAQTASCTPNSYWNFGPKVTTTVDRNRGTATVDYICGHVEG